jgi:hypothetical protein
MKNENKELKNENKALKNGNKESEYEIKESENGNNWIFGRFWGLRNGFILLIKQEIERPKGNGNGGFKKMGVGRPKTEDFFIVFFLCFLS